MTGCKKQTVINYGKRDKRSCIKLFRETTEAFEDVFAAFPNAHWGNARHYIIENRGFSEWIFTGTKLDGTKVEITGCDLFTFKDGKIAIKNSYRKNRLPRK